MICVNVSEGNLEMSNVFIKVYHTYTVL